MQPDHILLFILAVIGVAFLFKTTLYKEPQVPPNLGFTKQHILTKAEISFFTKLRKAVPELDVFPQVAMSGIIKPVYEAGDGRYMPAFNKISQKRVDFVVCDPRQDFDVICIVELDDRTHDAEKDRRRDEITASAGYRTIRFPSANKPSVSEIRHLVVSAKLGDRRMRRVA